MSTRHRSPVSEHQTPVSFIRHRSTKHWATRHLSTRHRLTRIFATRYRSTRYWATRYGLASTGQPGTGQPGTSHSSSRHQSLFDDYQAPFTSHWAPVNECRVPGSGNWSVNHLTPVTGQPGTGQPGTWQSITGHQSTHQAPVIRQQTLGTETGGQL